MFGVTKGDKGRRHRTLPRQFLRRPRENEKRFAAWFFLNVDIAPAHRLANPGAECFRNCLFRSETRSQMARWKFHRHGIRDFAIGKYTMEEFFAKTLN